MWSIVFSPDGRTNANASNDEALRLWEASTGKELTRREGLSWLVWWLVVFNPDNKILPNASKDGALRLREASTGKELARREGLLVCVVNPFQPRR